MVIVKLIFLLVYNLQKKLFKSNKINIFNSFFPYSLKITSYLIKNLPKIRKNSNTRSKYKKTLS